MGRLQAPWATGAQAQAPDRYHSMVPVRVAALEVF